MVHQIIVVTPKGIAHVLTLKEYLTFVRVRIIKKGRRSSIEFIKVDNVSRPIHFDENIRKIINQIEDSMVG